MATLPAVPDALPSWIPAGLRADFIKNLRFMAAVAEGRAAPGLCSDVTREEAKAQFKRLHRLCTDTRMETVYRTPMRRKRGKDYKQTGELEFVGTRHKYRSQEQAIGAFIINGSAATSTPYTSKGLVTKQTKGLERAQKALTRAAGDAYDSRVKEELSKYAERCAEMARSNFIALGRVNTRAQVNAYIKTLVYLSRLYFGSALYGTVATVANVALERSNITARNVRKLAP